VHDEGVHVLARLVIGRWASCNVLLGRALSSRKLLLVAKGGITAARTPRLMRKTSSRLSVVQKMFRVARASADRRRSKIQFPQVSQRSKAHDVFGTNP